MEKPTINEQLVSDEVVELILPDGATLEVSKIGYDLREVTLSPTKNFVETTGRGYVREYESDGTESWAPSLTVGWGRHTGASTDDLIDTDQLFDFASRKVEIRRYPFGKVTGRRVESGEFWLRLSVTRQGEKMALAVSGLPASDFSIGTV